MRLVLLHGINQQSKDPIKLKQHWIDDIEEGLAQPGALSHIDVSMPYYGDILFDLANRKASGAIAQGAEPGADRAFAEFLVEGLEEQAELEQISRSDIREEQERQTSEAGHFTAVEQGFPMDRRINAIVSLLEKISPFRGDIAVRLLDQAYAYLKQPQATSAVDTKVLPQLESGPMVLVAHSLGTVVSFKLLRALNQSDRTVTVPLYVTVGSPLTLSTVQRGLGPSFETPDSVRRWINLRDPDDFITLNRSLSAPLFSESIENLSDFNNPGKDAHAIPGYLSHPPVAHAIADALNL